MFSVLIYLNFVEEGGETHYPVLKKKVKPELGKLICHINHLDGEDLKESLHGAMPVLKGEKWALVCWIRERKWKAQSHLSKVKT